MKKMKKIVAIVIVALTLAAPAMATTTSPVVTPQYEQDGK